jgi:hypothetical protein
VRADADRRRADHDQRRLFLLFFFLDLVGFRSNPYLGIVTFLLLLAVFALGLVLIPLGLWRERRRQRAGLSGRSALARGR